MGNIETRSRLVEAGDLLLSIQLVPTAELVDVSDDQTGSKENLGAAQLDITRHQPSRAAIFDDDVGVGVYPNPGTLKSTRANPDSAHHHGFDPNYLPSFGTGFLAVNFVVNSPFHRRYNTSFCGKNSSSAEIPHYEIFTPSRIA